jgi:hypothetical protein
MEKYMGIKEIASKVREQLKKEFPKAVFSVTIKRYSGGQSMDITLMSAPFEAFRYDITKDMFGDNKWITDETIRQSNEYLQKRQYAQVNQYQLKESYDPERPMCNGSALTKEAWNIMARACEIVRQYHWDESDIMTDYFNCNFYYHPCIGKFDKPFVNTKKSNIPVNVCMIENWKKPFPKQGLSKKSRQVLDIILK